jgi:hypothetical protein
MDLPKLEIPYAGFLILFFVLFLLWLFFSGDGNDSNDSKNINTFIRDTIVPEKANPPPVVEKKETEPEQTSLFKSRGERECKRVMEKVYGVPFITVRPNWLKNPKTGRNLELDCYNDELKIAVEYNGEQHYNWPNFTNCTKENFVLQLERDQIKKKLCKKERVYLITVPYTVSIKNIEKYIMERLP